MYEKLDRETLVALKAKNLPKATLTGLVVASEDPDKVMPEVVAEAQGYLDQFLPWSSNCLCCDRQLAGIFGTFTWGLANGEGYCGSCSYPCRAIHRIELATLGKITFAYLILQYHPDTLEPKS